MVSQSRSRSRIGIPNQPPRPTKGTPSVDVGAPQGAGPSAVRRPTVVDEILVAGQRLFDPKSKDCGRRLHLAPALPQGIFGSDIVVQPRGDNDRLARCYRIQRGQTNADERGVLKQRRADLAIDELAFPGLGATQDDGDRSAADELFSDLTIDILDLFRIESTSGE